MRQECILLPLLFSIYSESIRRSGQDGFEGSIKVGGRTTTSLRYADDVALLAGCAEELQELLDRIRETSKEREDQN